MIVTAFWEVGRGYSTYSQKIAATAYSASLKGTLAVSLKNHVSDDSPCSVIHLFSAILRSRVTARSLVAFALYTENNLFYCTPRECSWAGRTHKFIRQPSKHLLHVTLIDTTVASSGEPSDNQLRV